MKRHGSIVLIFLLLNHVNNIISQDVYTDVYDVLGLKPDAQLSAVKTNYRKLSLQFHPDKAPAEKKDEYAKKFALIAEANSILSDVDKKKAYDELLEKIKNLLNTANLGQQQAKQMSPTQRNQKYQELLRSLFDEWHLIDEGEAEVIRQTIEKPIANKSLELYINWLDDSKRENDAALFKFVQADAEEYITQLGRNNFDPALLSHFGQLTMTQTKVPAQLSNVLEDLKHQLERLRISLLIIS